MREQLPRHKQFALFVVSFMVFIMAFAISAPILSTRPLYAQPDAATIFIKESNFALAENSNQPAAVTVQVSGQLTSTVAITYTLGGTAQEGVDYTSSPKTVNFSPQDTTDKVIQITPLNNSQDAADKTIELSLRSSLTNTLDSNKSTIIITLVNDDCGVSNTSPATAQNMAVATSTGNRCLLDDQYFFFAGKKDRTYEITTQTNSSSAIDTHAFLYSDNAFTAELLNNDDASGTTLNSRIIFTASADQNYFIRIQNKNKSNTPRSDFYSLSIALITPPNPTPAPPTTTPTPGPTRIPADEFEDNLSFETAAVIATDTTYDLNFVPVTGSGPDNDFFKLWVKANWYYSCETLNLSPYNDTNMILYDQNYHGLAGNDDKLPSDLGSKLNFVATYNGWVYLLVGPNVDIEYIVSDQYTYQLACSSSFGTPTATPWPTIDPAIVETRTAAAATAAAEATANAPTATPIPITEPITVTTESGLTGIDPDFENSILITPIDEAALTPIPDFVEQFVVVVLTNNAQGQPQGVGNMPVALYNQAAELLAFGYTNSSGNFTAKISSNTTTVEVLIPYLGISEFVNYPATKAVQFTMPTVEFGDTGG